MCFLENISLVQKKQKKKKKKKRLHLDLDCLFYKISDVFLKIFKFHVFIVFLFPNILN